MGCDDRMPQEIPAADAVHPLRKKLDGLLRAGKLWRGRPGLKTVSYTVDSRKLAGTGKLALVTDLHSCAYGQDMHELTDALDAENPDAVLLGGDIFDDVLPPENALCFLKYAAEHYPCYYVSGNHERRGGNLDICKKQMQDMGICMLDGKALPITVGQAVLTLCGVDDPHKNAHRQMHEKMKMLARQVPADAYKILLSHRPEKALLYMEYGFDLALCGHAHGGQWRIPGLINGLYAPEQGVFPKYAGGRYDFPAGSVIVSRGLARETTWMPRICNRPELVVIHLKGEAEDADFGM